MGSFAADCLFGRRALVTGGGTGIGKRICEIFMAHGADTIILSRNAATLKQTAQELERRYVGRSCEWADGDVRDAERIDELVESFVRGGREINILVNAAAGNFLCAAEELSYKGFKTVMEIDAHGTFIVSSAVFKHAFKPQHFKQLKKIQQKNPDLKTESAQNLAPNLDQSLAANSAKRVNSVNRFNNVIINISMTLHYCGTLLQVHAGAAKGAIDAMTKHLAVEWGPFGVRTNSVAPGPINNTAGLSKLLDGGSSEGSEMVPLGRFGEGEEVGHICLFLSLPEASYITGANLVVDGGHWLTACNFPVLHPTTRNQWLQNAKL